MTASWRSILITVVVAALCGFAGAMIGARHFNRATAESTPSLRQFVDTMLAKEEFSLTAEQKRQVADIDAAYTHQNNLIRTDLKISNAELTSALAEDMTLNPMSQVYIQEIQESVGRLQTTTITYVLDIRKVLTPKQQELYDERILQALTRESP